MSNRTAPLRVGIVGCGRIAQVMHLPYLDELPQFQVTAIADLSRQTTDALAARYRVPLASQDFRDVVAADVDVVAVLSPNHVEVAEAAIDAGKHVFVEKPLAFDPDAAQRLVDLAKARGVVLAVGYMKYHDRAYEELRQRASTFDARLVRARVLFGRAFRPTRFYGLVAADDLQAGATTAGSFDREARAVETHLGPAHARHARLYTHFLNLGCHDLAVLRGVLGPPERVLAATTPTDVSVVAILAYPDGAQAVLEVGEWPQQAWWDERLEVIGDADALILEFGNPWVRYSASRLWHRRGRDAGAIVEELPLAHDDQFRDQWIHLYEVFANDAPLRSVGEDAVADIRLALDIVRALPA